MNPATKLTGVSLAIILIAQTTLPVKAVTFNEFKANISNKFQASQERQLENRETNNYQVGDENNNKNGFEAQTNVKLTVTGKAELREQKATQQAEGSQERLRRIIERIAERLNKHDERLTNWLERAKARLEILKLDPEAKNVTEVEAALVKAEASLKAAQLAKANVLVTLVPQLSVDDWKTQNQEAKEFKQAVVKTQLAYNLVISDFKQALAELKKSVE